MMDWETWKKGFDAWESTTAKYLETVLRSPALLTPSGAMLSAAMKSKAAVDRAAAAWWSAWGLPTRRDQERALHSLNQLQSKIIDLEERLAELQPKPTATLGAKQPGAN
ncbi:MAG: poly(R)-hydroxyalkanoic acid synthase subunit PhaE [Polyangiales bacterium]